MKPLAPLANDWPALSAMLDEALEVPSADRGAWLEALRTRPGLTDSLHSALRELLASAGVETGDFISTLPRLQPAGATAAELGAPGGGSQIGPYRLISELGRGGMGAVWLAERTDGSLKRRVALKLPHVSWVGSLAERLARERDILASLEHPNIARLYDAGVDALGRPWLALEYVQGRAIDVVVRERELDLAARLELLLQVCSAVAYAHSRFVIHRDLKPANILVTDEGQARLLDFGIAKLVQEGESTEATALTRQAGAALTPDYASPEQVRGEPLGAASDVYSLGVVAYELLTGQRPYKLKRGSMAELEEAIALTDPPLASQVAEQPAVRKALRGDLDAVLNQALKKLPSERYASVDALAHDLRAVLDGRPVNARPDTLAYRTGRWLSRNRLPAAATLLALTAFALAVGVGPTTLIIMALGIGLAAALWQASEARRGRAAAQAAGARAEAAAGAERQAAEQARQEAARARAIGDFMVQVFATNTDDQPDPEAARSLTAFELLGRGVQKIERLHDDDPQTYVQLLRTFGKMYEEVWVFDEAIRLHRRGLAAASAHFGSDHLEAHLTRVRLASCLQGSAAHEEACALLDLALAGLRRQASGTMSLAAALYVETIAHGALDPGRAARAAEEVIALMARLPESRGTYEEGGAWAALGRARQGLGDIDGAIEALRNAVAMAEATESGSSGRGHRYSLANALIAGGRFDEAADTFGEILEEVTRIQDRPLRNSEVASLGNFGIGRLRAFCALGDTAAACAELERVERWRAATPGADVQGIHAIELDMRRAEVAAACGDVLGTISHCRAALARDEARWFQSRMLLYVLLAEAHGLQGDLDEMEHAVAALLPLIAGKHAARSVRLDGFGIAAACAAARGDAALSARLLDQGREAIGPMVALRRGRLALALAQARVHRLLGAPALGDQEANAWIEELLAQPRDVPRIQQAELALLLVESAATASAAAPLLERTCAYLNAQHGADSPLRRRAAALALVPDTRGPGE